MPVATALPGILSLLEYINTGFGTCYVINPVNGSFLIPSASKNSSTFSLFYVRTLSREKLIATYYHQG